MLSTPPAFILSQDQTLMLKSLHPGQNLAWLIFNRSTVCLVRLNRSEISLFRIFRVVLLFSYQGSLFRCLADSLSSLSQCFLFVNYFFNFLFTHLSFIYKPGRYVLRSAVRFNSLSNIPYLSSCVNHFLDLKFLLNLSPTCIITLGP